MKRLIVNADDFGLSRGINRAITEAHHRGIVTSTTLMASAPAFDDAVHLAKQGSTLKVGCHLVLLRGSLLGSPDSIPSLYIQRRGKSVPRTGLDEFALDAWRGRVHAADISREVRAQIERIRASGIEPSHVDSHKHSHVLPQVFRPMLRTAHELGIRAVRNPFEPGVRFSTLLQRSGLWKRHAATRVMRTWHSAFLRCAKDLGMVTTDGTIGISSTGSLDQRLLTELLRFLPGGTWELICHPACDGPELNGLTRLGRSGEVERELLVSEETKQAISVAGISLITYADL